MRNFAKLFFVAVLGAGAAIAACGDDDDNVVRTRPVVGGDAASDAEGGTSTLACGVPIPATYDGASFALNAKDELDLKARVLAINDKMKTAEGTMPMPVTSADLQAIFTAGPPSLRTIATAYTQATVDTYFTQFGEGTTRTWKPEDVEADGGGEGGTNDAGVPVGGKYDNASIVNAVGVDLREATGKLLINGSLYNYALQLAGGAVTGATVDRLVALYGSTPTLLNAADFDGGTEQNGLIAEYAFKRDSKIGAPGTYRKIKGALLVAKAAAVAGEACRTDLQGALNVFFLEWERASYLTVIYYLNAAGTNAIAIPAKGQAALHAYGEALGFAQSFKGIPQDRRRITDVQIDGLLATMGADTPYRLVTRSGERVQAFATAIQQIGGIYGFTPTEIEEAKKAY
ncbi:MAG: hypothetical protein JWP87_1955 [Labilithrix sp.]|nr:hypothetical protein [Labilithrix sp.]